MSASSPDQDAPVVVYVTTPDRTIADSIAAALVEHHEAACVNIVAGVQSVYRWQGRIERDTEQLLVIKTRQARLAAIDARLATLHPDDVPERIALPIVDGAPAYMQWLVEQTTPET
ncbi:divalent-cation tolerance protein CutA [Salinisphaera sp. Q1T1-3]|uniref:divalent-cation tolerance protein CutA n=1 Tax=Salinisphaera sp. Q1T1-3 TaxID=2321229 RepID=UPI000E764A8D|nr:divalent-cation tolerance protein CutA [Salinisphaera sp. Q1T1-3]RJS94657.1 divalent-cation tolerance protein CutA [Salinisphaera sp. Q1T1-3]